MKRFALAISAGFLLTPLSHAENIILTSAPVTLKQPRQAQWEPADPVVTVLSSNRSCDPWTPLPVTVTEGQAFNQERSCLIKTTSSVQPMEKNTATGVLRNAGDAYDSITEAREPETQQEIGTLHLFDVPFKAGSLDNSFAGVYRRIDSNAQTGERIPDTNDYSVLFYYYRNSDRTMCQVRYGHVRGLGFNPSVSATAYSEAFMASHQHVTLFRADGTVFREYRFGAARSVDGSWYISANVPCADVNNVYANPGSFARLRLAND